MKIFRTMVILSGILFCRDFAFGAVTPVPSPSPQVCACPTVLPPPSFPTIEQINAMPTVSPMPTPLSPGSAPAKIKAKALPIAAARPACNDQCSVMIGKCVKSKTGRLFCEPNDGEDNKQPAKCASGCCSKNYNMQAGSCADSSNTFPEIEYKPDEKVSFGSAMLLSMLTACSSVSGLKESDVCNISVNNVCTPCNK